MTRQIRIAIGAQCRRFCCCCCRRIRNRAGGITIATTGESAMALPQLNRRGGDGANRRRKAAQPAIAAEQPSDAGTFEGERESMCTIAQCHSDRRSF